MSHFHTYYSNRVEILFEKLKKVLFTGKPRVFTRRLIIVPSQAMKNWLLLELAKDPQCGIAMGIQVQQLDQALASMIPSVFRTPSSFEMALLIEAQLREVVTLSEPVWKDLQTYLGIFPSASVTRKAERRIVLLAEQLALLFLRYSKYGGCLLQQWKTAPVSDWQIALWNRVWKNAGNMQPLFFHMEHLAPPVDDWEIHVFATSFIPRIQHSCLIRLSQALPVNYYILSPCRAFWSDIRSDKETRLLKRFWQSKGASISQLDVLEEFLRDCNPLLANFGRLGRQMAEQVEENEEISFEDYCLPISVLQHPIFIEKIETEVVQIPSSQNPSLLEMVQADILLLRHPKENALIPVSAADRSIQVHAFPSKMREVETLLDILKQTLNGSALQLSDIVVMAPDIKEYAPLITTVFGGNHPELDYQVMDMHIPLQNSYVSGFLQLLDLAGSRWEASALMEVLDNPYLKRKFHIQHEEVREFREWIRGAGIRWGEDVDHRNAMLKSHYCTQNLVDDSPAGTWKEGVGRMLAGLVYTSLGNDCLDDLEKIPLESIDTSSSELIGQLIDIWTHLRENLKPVADGTYKSLQDWSLYLHCVEESFFSIDSTDQEAEEGQRILRKLFDTVGLASSLASDRSFPFSSIRRHLERALSEQSVCYRESHLNAIRFCSLLPMRALPSKVIVLLGLNEGSFPRTENVVNLDLMYGNPSADYCPSQTDFDRYLFLEAIISARKHLILSYLNCSQEDNKEQTPSLVITELLNYLDSGYAIDSMTPSKVVCYTHPANAFDACYFKIGAPFPSYSETAYRIAKTYYALEKQQSHRFFDRYTTFGNEEMQGPIEWVDLKALAAFAKNPLKYYFNKTLGIYIAADRKQMFKPEDEFMFAPWEKNRIKWEMAKGNPSQVIAYSKKQGILPFGLVQDLAIAQLNEEGANYKKIMSKLAVEPQSLFNLYFSAHASQSNRLMHGWEFPPIKVELEDGKTVYLTGKVTDVSMQGLVVPLKRELKSLAVHLPQLLFYLSAIEHYGLKALPRFILAGDGTVLSYDGFDVDCFLKKYLAYYFKARTTPSFLLPEWIKDCLSHPDDLQKTVHKSLFDDQANFFNEYAFWCFQNDEDCPSGEKMMEHWKEEVQDLFESLFRQVHARKSKSKGEML